MEVISWREKGSVSSPIGRELRLVVEGCVYALVVWSLYSEKNEPISWSSR